MVKVGNKYKPSLARQVWGGELTQFSIPQTHKDESGDIVRDGFINVLCKGVYPWVKDNGDQIEIKKITGASLKWYKGKPYFGITAEIEYHTARDLALAKEDGGSWDDDIPEELL